jgi:hypothetical protein
MYAGVLVCYIFKPLPVNFMIHPGGKHLEDDKERAEKVNRMSHTQGLKATEMLTLNRRELLRHTTFQVQPRDLVVRVPDY